VRAFSASRGGSYTGRLYICEHGIGEPCTEYLRGRSSSSSLGEGGHGKKCHIILVYGDAAHRSLRKFILLHRDSVYSAVRSRGREYRLYGIVGVTEPGLPGWIANRRRVSSFAFRQRYIRAFALRMNATSARDDGEMEFISV